MVLKTRLGKPRKALFISITPDIYACKKQFISLAQIGTYQLNKMKITLKLSGVS